MSDIIPNQSQTKMFSKRRLLQSQMSFIKFNHHALLTFDKIQIRKFSELNFSQSKTTGIQNK